MKKISSTLAALGALFVHHAAAAADAPMSLNLGATVREFVTVADQDAAAGEELNAVSNSNLVRVFAKGTTKWENGVEASAYVRFEAVGRKTEDVDEAYIDLKTAYGTLRAGEKEGWNASFIGDPAPSAFLTTDERIIGEAGIKGRNGTAQSDTFTFKRFAGDPLGVQYRSPEVNGFQFGLSYHPRTDNGAGPIDRVQLNSNAIDASAVYTVRFEAVTLKVSGGYIHVDGKRAPGISTAQAAWNANVTLKVDAFTIGGTYLDFNPSSGFGEQDATVGVLWAHGAWKLSGDFARMERRPALLAGLYETTTTLRGQVAYKIGPGLEAGFAAFHTRQKDAAGQLWRGVGGLAGLKLEL